MSYLYETYAANPETTVYKSKSEAKRNSQRKLLMGTWMGVIEDNSDSWLKIHTFGKDGYVKKSSTNKNNFIKIFFIDVGQGDSVLIESPGKTILVDGGPGSNLWNYLTKWKYKWIIQAGKKVKIDEIFVSHFDYDHFHGLTKVINDSNFKIGKVYHNGIARFDDTKNQRDPNYDSALGKTDYVKNVHARTILRTTFSTINDCKNLVNNIPAGKKGLLPSFKKFLDACIKANNENRLGNTKRLTNRDNYVTGYSQNKDFSIQVLGPVPTEKTGKIEFDWFTDSSHTRNGHSLVLKQNYKGKTVLLGGDLNTESENHLMDSYSNSHPFEVDVAKSCHHGSSDFTIKFLKKLKPSATVISSGDNESYSHPRADAIGCTGKYSKGARPLVFSTELARSYKSGKKIHYGLINMRTDGNQIVLAQMKENKNPKDLWDSYVVE